MREPCQGRVVGLPAPGRTWLGLPRLNGFLGEPDCQAPALAEAGVVLTPVRYLALLPGNMLATVLVQLEGHAGHPGAGERSSCYSGSTCSATGRIRATTPRSHHVPAVTAATLRPILTTHVNAGEKMH